MLYEIILEIAGPEIKCALEVSTRPVSDDYISTLTQF